MTIITREREFQGGICGITEDVTDMDNSEFSASARAAVERRSSVRPRIAIILGSGLGGVADAIDDPTTIPYEEIPHWPRATAVGHAGRLVIGTLEGIPVVAMQGRIHYYEGYSMEEVTFPIRVFGELGVGTLIATNASGGVNLGYRPGDLVAIYDHINYMGTNPLVGRNNERWGARFPDMTYAYDREYVDLLESAAREEGITLRRGVYIAFSGPSYETPAEIRMSRILGADLVGMSTVPEVITANHMGMRVAAVSCVANFAAGVKSEKLHHQEVLDAMSAAADSMTRLIRAFMRRMPGQK
jgi:purine-nucleoside phosphorylase